MSNGRGLGRGHKKDKTVMPSWLPAGAQVFIDFKNGHYYFDGAERTREETVEENSDYDVFDTNLIIPGVGFSVTANDPDEAGSGPVLSAAARAGLLGGFTVVASVAFDAASGDGSTASFQLELTDLPNYSASWLAAMAKRRVQGAYIDTREVRDYNAVGFNDTIALAPSHKVAATLASDHFAISTDGGAIAVASGTPVDISSATDIGFRCSVVAVSGASTAVLETIAFYAVQADSALPSLSS
jgi:hypothetical protein